MSDNRTDKRQHAPATRRNRDAIFEVLRRLLPETGLVLEIASGSGEHAAYFAPRLPGLDWQPSDPDPVMLESIAAWSIDLETSNLRAPMMIDATAPDWPVAAADAILCINMIHIAPWAASEGLIAGAGRTLQSGGILYLYGPFRLAGAHTAPSNREFDAELRQHNAAWGVRDLNDVVALAIHHGLTLVEVVDMPANNKSVIFRKN